MSVRTCSLSAAQGVSGVARRRWGEVSRQHCHAGSNVGTELLGVGCAGLYSGMQRGAQGVSAHCLHPPAHRQQPGRGQQGCQRCGRHRHGAASAARSLPQRLCPPTHLSAQGSAPRSAAAPPSSAQHSCEHHKKGGQRTLSGRFGSVAARKESSAASKPGRRCHARNPPQRAAPGQLGAHLKSQDGRPRMGTVSGTPLGSPRAANASRAAPPEGIRSRPSRRATLSYASPSEAQGTIGQMSKGC